MKGQYYTGTSGLVLPYKNKQFYPEAFREKSRLEMYGVLFNSIEINSSFYKLPMRSTVEKWAASVPDNFRFTYKLWRDITHQKGFVYREEDVENFMQVIGGAGAKKGCLLVQFPPSLRVGSLPEVRKLINSITLADPHREWKLALEFRHETWYREETFRLLNDSAAGLVIHDKTFSASPMEEMDVPFVYVRFHGPGGDYRGSYDDSFLYEYAGYIRNWLEAGMDVYSYFNNTMGDAIHDLRVLRDYVEKTENADEGNG